MLGTEGGVGSLSSVGGEWYVWMVKDRKHWKGESLNFRLEFVPEAVSIGCGQGDDLGRWDAICQAQGGCRMSKADMASGLHGICSPGAETDMNRATTGTHG